VPEKDDRAEAGNVREPAWPSADSDVAGANAAVVSESSESPGGAQYGQAEATHELPVPKVTGEEPATVWVTRQQPRQSSPAGSSAEFEENSQPHRRPQLRQSQQPRQAPDQRAWPQGPQQPARRPERRSQAPLPPPPVPPRQPQQQHQQHQQPRPAQQQGTPPASGHAVPMRIEPGSEPRPAPATTGEQSRTEASGVTTTISADRADRDDRAHSVDRAVTADASTRTASDTGGAEGPPTRRRRRGVLVGALALILVVAVGVTLALPAVSNRLALPWAPNAPQGEPPEPVAVSRTLHGPDRAAPAPTPAGVAAALEGPASASALGELTGIVVDPATGEVLWERGANEAKTPASTTKLLAAAAALLELDHGMRIPTKVVAGDEPGTVVLVAGGDVTLSSLPEGQESLYPGAARLDDLVAQVKEATGGDVQRVALDLSVFEGPAEASSWDPADAPSTFAAPVEPVMLDGGRIEATKPKSMRLGDPAAAFAREFAQRLGAEAASGTVTVGEDARLLAEVRSPPLTELVDTMLTQSDNLLADVVARQVAIATGAEPSFTGAAQATLDVLERNGFDVSGARLSDDSGLSPENKVRANLLGDLLAVAAAPEGEDPRAAELRPMLGGLPIAGGSGTLKGRFDTEAADQGTGWVRAKTGTLSGVSTLAGVVLDTDGRLLVFALMSSGSSILEAQPALDTVAATLRACGCR
jgi:D-alanyl-D-alanine carboxypeptidase/D-alanyl-D-alanine-endopeptidase (penicillin-binding protein 4)